MADSIKSFYISCARTLGLGDSNLLFDTIIPRNIRLAEAPSYGKPCLIYDPESTGTKAYLKLAKEILKRDEKGENNNKGDN